MMDGPTSRATSIPTSKPTCQVTIGAEIWCLRWVCQTRLTSVQRVQKEDKEGMAAKSATIKCKVSALVVRLVGTEGACETCKKVGVAV